MQDAQIGTGHVVGTCQSDSKVDEDRPRWIKALSMRQRVKRSLQQGGTSSIMTGENQTQMTRPRNTSMVESESGGLQEEQDAIDGVMEPTSH
jgi:hypothetical protein